jgi:hypothetical protein
MVGNSYSVRSGIIATRHVLCDLQLCFCKCNAFCHSLVLGINKSPKKQRLEFVLSFNELRNSYFTSY